MIEVRNPHSVLAAIQSRPKDVIEIRVSRSAGQSWDEVVKQAKSNNIKVIEGGGGARPSESRGQRGHGHVSHAPKDGRQSETHGLLKPHPGSSIEELLASVKIAQNPVFLALDCLQDPHNLGAVFRTAGFFGVSGIIMTEERSVGLTGVVYEVASGGVESVPFCSITNLSQAFKSAKEAGFWIMGTSEHAKESVFSQKRDRPWLIVLGNEEKGMRRLTEENCDLLCSIPAQGAVTSLNVSVASGILISHFLKK